MGEPAIWLVMARTGGDYEYTDWPVVWRRTQELAEATARDYTKRIAELNAIVPPCPAVEDNDRRWAFYERREKRARETIEAELGVSPDASFFVTSVSFYPAESGPGDGAHKASAQAGSGTDSAQPQPKPESGE